MTPPEPQRRNHLALWAGATTLFTNLAAINLIALLGEENNATVAVVAAVISAVAASAAVFARQKYNDEKSQRERNERDTNTRPH